ncbi:unnamed protein product [Dimorphilus gyrociliatus]|uniref:RING-type domain-containing protein n=1 Tax=Dimorphilus gyrociliatus TaxID=2664684 RepID=A0A7I8W224_9ANNE|nr:unnamed protein product [Dimorphilus gyrociliatus]
MPSPIICCVCDDMLFYENSYTLACSPVHRLCRKCLCSINVCLPPRTNKNFRCPVCRELIRWPSKGLDAFKKVPELNSLNYLRQQLLLQYNNLIEEKILKIEYLMTRPVDPDMEYHNRELRKQIDNGYFAKINQLKGVAEEVELWDGYPFQDSIEAMRRRLKIVISQNLLGIMMWKRSLYMYRLEVLEGLHDGPVQPQNKFFFQFRDQIKGLYPMARKFFVLTCSSTSVGSVYQLPYESHIEPDMIIAKDGLLNMGIAKRNDKIMVISTDKKECYPRIRTDTVSTASGNVVDSVAFQIKIKEPLRIVCHEMSFSLVSGDNIYRKQKAKKPEMRTRELNGKFVKAIDNDYFYLGPDHTLLVTDRDFKRLRKRQVTIYSTDRSKFSFLRDILLKLGDGFHFLSTGKYMYIVHPRTYESKAYETVKVFGIHGFIECSATKEVVTFFIVTPQCREKVLLLQYSL